LHDAFVAIAGEAAARALPSRRRKPHDGGQDQGRLSLLAAAMVIARRDFMAILWSRSFIFFLLGPLFPVLVGAMAGSIGNHVENNADQPQRAS
jgi:hypothetical protein